MLPFNASAAAACLLLCACSAIVDSDRKQCSSDADCTSRGAAFEGAICLHSICQPEPTWGCLLQEPTQQKAPGPFRVSLQTVDIVTQAAMSGVSAKLCRKIDLMCEMPLATATTDDQGKVVFNVPRENGGYGYSGYVRFIRDDVLPGIYVFNPPVEKDTEILAVNLASPAIASVLAQQIDPTLTLDTERGLVLLSTVDCLDRPASGVSFVTDADKSAAPFYSVNGLPTAMATATDMDGYGGLINVAPGTLAVTGKRQSDMRSVGALSLLIQGATLTYSKISPLRL